MRKYILLLALSAASPVPGQSEPITVRVAHFPNVTHAVVVAGHANGVFERELQPEAEIRWKLFTAGPQVIEAIFSGDLDIAYVGPNPAINGYVRSNGEALRIVAGATSGGAALVVRADANIERPEDFDGKTVATPQLGNTQDVALRDWLQSHGLQTNEKGGTVRVVPISHADQYPLFLRKQIDAAWAAEPWASRLILEAGGRLFLDERNLWPDGDFATTQLIVRTEFLRRHPGVVRKWIRAHVKLTLWFNGNREAGKRLVNREILRETGMAFSSGIVDEAFTRMRVSYDPARASLLVSARRAYTAGYLGRKEPVLDGIYELSLLNEVLSEMGLPKIP